jgi:hypothetical protein
MRIALADAEEFRQVRRPVKRPPAAQLEQSFVNGPST